MRKAAWGAIALAVLALHFATPVREVGALRTLASLGGLAGYLLLSFDPPVEDRVRYRAFLIAGIVAGLVGFLVTVTGTPYPFGVLARVAAVGSVALPLWLVARPPQFVFVAAGALALATILPVLDDAGGYATSMHAYVAAAGALWTAWLIEHPLPLPGQKKPARVVVARDVVFLSPEEKAERLADLERRFQAGEIAEHKYWDKRQEIESR